MEESGLTEVDCFKVFEGTYKTYTMHSDANNATMRFAVFLPK
jgi:hypothetical protein